jgi:uncharacterized protein (TIGR02118 family)
MSFVYELALTGVATEAASAQAWFDVGPAQAWSRIANLSSLDLYRPVEGTDDPYNKDDGPPLLIAVAEFASADALKAAAARLDLSLAGLPLATRATFTPMERKFYPVAGETTPGPLRAPFSYVVRYRRPAEDEAAFVAHYVADHPGLEGQFPGIRSVMCYFPLATPKSERCAPAEYMLGNEVVFDNVADFNAAMQSPVRHEMRAHFHTFPKFSGALTHFAMLRERLLG